MKGLISGIKRMEIHDGDGIRTTVFFKGCPLRCVWCHNPESIGYKKELAYFDNKCIGCASCYNVCENGAVNMQGYRIDRQRCINCFKCAEICPTEALVPYGREYEAKELVKELMSDAPFFRNGRGGITLSGGECLSQGDFTHEVAKMLHEKGISVYVDTCGYVKREVLDRIIPYTDRFLFDIKAISEDRHIKATGKSNSLILDNLKYLDSLGCDIEIRIPFVPEYNGDEIGRMAELISTLKSVKKVKVLKYHNYAGSRYLALGMKNTLPDTVPNEEERLNAVKAIKCRCPNTTVE